MYCAEGFSGEERAKLETLAETTTSSVRAQFGGVSEKYVKTKVESQALYYISIRLFFLRRAKGYIYIPKRPTLRGHVCIYFFPGRFLFVFDDKVNH